MLYVIKRAIRGHSPTLIGGAQVQAERWGRVKRRGTKMNRTNLRFFPRDKDFDEGTLRRKLEVNKRGKTTSYDILIRPYSGDTEALLDFVRDCYENGI